MDLAVHFRKGTASAWKTNTNVKEDDYILVSLRCVWQGTKHINWQTQ